MTEIRIQWNVPGKASSPGTTAAELWHPDSPRNRKMLQIILESAIEIHGAGTHWIAVREYDPAYDVIP